MDCIELGEGTTPREISDPNRFVDPTAETSPWRRRVKIGSILLCLFAVVYFNPLFGSRSGHVFAADAHFSSGHHLGFGSSSVFGIAGHKLRIDYRAKVRSGSLVIHVWPTGLPGQSSVKTIRLQHDVNTHCDVVFPSTGLYTIEIDTFRSGRDFDVDYEVSWRAW